MKSILINIFSIITILVGLTMVIASYYFGIVFILAGVYLIYAKNKQQKKDKEKTETLLLYYKEALKSTDKAKALEYGRAYYSNQRIGGILTIYDEQAITNDLNTMKL